MTAPLEQGLLEEGELSRPGLETLLAAGAEAVAAAPDHLQPRRGRTAAFTPVGSRGPGPAGLLFPLTGFLNFGVLFGAGLWYRHRPEIHKRLMLLALVPLAVEPLNHVLGHLVGHALARPGSGRASGAAFTLVLLSVSAIHDRMTEGRIHPVSLWVPLILFVWLSVLPFVVLPSAAWHQLAAWLLG